MAIRMLQAVLLPAVAALYLLVGGCVSLADNPTAPDPDALARELSAAERLECRATFDQTKIDFVVSDPDVLKSLAETLKFKGAPRPRPDAKVSALDVVEMTIVAKDKKESLTLIGNVIMYGPKESFRVDLQSFDFFNKLKKLAEASQK
jgi:hypothetical protein